MMAEAMSRLHNPRRPSPAPMAAPAKIDSGEQPEGDHMHAAAESLHAAEPGSKHMIVSHDGLGMKSHGIHEDGTHEPEQGAHDHENIEELKSHLGKFFNEEEDEPKEDDDGEEPEENQSLY
jgi:hypothetical protein